MSLVTLADMKTRVGELTNNFDTFLDAQCAMVSEVIENYCGRKFAVTAYTQTWFVDDFKKQNSAADKIYSFHFPITVVTQIIERTRDNDGVPDNVILDPLEFREHLATGRILRTERSGRQKTWFNGNSFLSPSEEIEVQYSAGYATIPLAIQEVVYALVTERYNKQVSEIDLNFGSDVQRVAIPGVISVDFDYTLQANERKSKFGMILGNYGNVLDPYRSERALLGSIREAYV